MANSKVGGVAIVIALVAMAFIGATSASATVLCKENAATCTGENIYPSGTKVEATAQHVSVEMGLGEPICSTSTIGGKTTAEKGAPMSIEISSMTFSGCTGLCSTMKALNLPYAGSLERTTGGDGKVTLASSGKGTPSFEMSNCSMFVTTCTYTAPEITLKAGSPALMVAEGGVSKLGGSFLCPSTVKFVGNYKVASPNPLYAEVGPGMGETALCKAQGTVCPSKASIYPSGTVIEAKATGPILRVGANDVYCPSSAISLETTAETGSPLPTKTTSITFPTCSGECQSVKAYVPVLGSLEATSGGDGTLKWNPGTYEYTFSNCVGWLLGLTCSYGHGVTGIPAIGGSSGNARFNQRMENLTRSSGSFLCPETAEVTATYHVSSPGSLWFAKVEA